MSATVARSPVDVEKRPSLPPLWLMLTLLWLVAAALRISILAIPPLLPAIHRDLHLSETLVGALSSLPIVLLAAAAVPGSFIIARVGAKRSLLLGLCIVVAAGAARGIGSSIPVLFAMTLVMSVGIAISQPALPSLVRDWLPDRAGMATAVYSNGFLFGEILPVALTVPLVLPFVGGHWQGALLLWSAPIALAALALLAAPPSYQPPGLPSRWWPDWRSGRTWLLGGILGCGSIGYFSTNAFLPDFLRATHHADLISAALTCLNVGQLPASVLVGVIPGRLVGRRWPVIGCGVIMVVSALIMSSSGLLTVIFAGTLGFASALIFILSLALAPMLAEEGDAHRLSAAMFTISYACAAAGSLGAGALWDASGAPLSALAPVLVAGVLMIGLAFRINASTRAALR